MTRRLFLTVLALTSIAPCVLGGWRHLVAHRHPITRPTYLFDEGQQAVIAWDGQEEILILSTNVPASHNAVRVEFLPLPSKPKEVRRAPPSVFKVMEEIIGPRDPRRKWIPLPDKLLGTDGGRLGQRKPPVVVMMHRRMHAPDIAVGGVDDFVGFREWVRKFLVGRGFADGRLEKRIEELRKLANEYLRDGYRYFVFDVIEVRRDVRTVEPVLCRFAAPKLYYPLRVSQYSEGRTTINLFLITPQPVNVWGTRTGFWAGRFPDRRSTLVKFRLAPLDIERLDFLPPGLTWRSAYFTQAVYKGPCSMLRADFLVPRPLMPGAGSY